MSPDTAATFRTEHDSMGEVQVPADALWGAQTARAVDNFPISGQPVPAEVVHALALLKAAAAEVNADLGVLDAERAGAVAAAAREVAGGDHDAEFPVDVFQTGSGTSTNMNVNEVVARLAHLTSGLDVHPNDHVNAGQSSNDTFPSALRIAATLGALQHLAPSLDHLAASLGRKEVEFADVVKAGRTHLMDAVPVTL
ncbi:MAG: aspA [Humibacillus sp.]|nr:aspA [Humibacillus sp.]